MIKVFVTNYGEDAEFDWDAMQVYLLRYKL